MQSELTVSWADPGRRARRCGAGAERSDAVAVLDERPAEDRPPAPGEVVEPATGLVFVELSHEWGHYTPAYPGYRDIEVRRVATHAMHGVLTQHVRTVMHNG